MKTILTVDDSSSIPIVCLTTGSDDSMKRQAKAAGAAAITAVAETLLG